MPFKQFNDPQRRSSAGDMVQMNNPLHGVCTATVLGSRYEPLLVDEPKAARKPHRFSRGMFAYFGQRTDRILERCSGAAIYTEDNQVLGHFRSLNEVGDTAFFPTFDR